VSFRNYIKKRRFKIFSLHARYTFLLLQFYYNFKFASFYQTLSNLDCWLLRQLISRFLWEIFATSTDFPVATVCPIKRNFVISRRLDEIRKNGCLLRITSDAIMGHAIHTNNTPLQWRAYHTLRPHILIYKFVESI